MPNQAKFVGFAWQESSAILPRIITAMYYSTPAGGLSGRISHPFWVLDYSRSHCGRVRVGATNKPWCERLPSIAHLYPPGTAYWEDRRSLSNMEAAYVVFSGGDEAGLRDCIPKRQLYARISDTHGLILGQLHAAAVAGSEKGTAGFWEAQTTLCALIQILRRFLPGEDGAHATIGADRVTTSASFVKQVDAFLASRVGGRISLVEIAEAVRVSPSTLSHRYAEEAGRSPHATFNILRLEVARSLIVRGQKLDAVAAQTGFCDAYHLSKAFSKYFAEPPGTYRRRLKTDSHI